MPFLNPIRSLLVAASLVSLGDISAHTQIVPGRIDPSFDGGSSNYDDYLQGANSVSDFLEMPDGDIWVGLNPYNATSAKIVRLKPDGSYRSALKTLYYGNSPAVLTLARHPNGGAFVGGRFNYNSVGNVKSGLAQVSPAGLLVPSFAPLASDFSAPSQGFNCGVVLAGGKILLGATASEPPLFQLNADGTRDPNFDLLVTPPPGQFPSVNALLLEPDGSVLVGGAFVELNGRPHTNLARLRPDGSVDATFQPNAPVTVSALRRLADGRIVVGLGDTRSYESNRNAVLRLLPDGNPDPTFTTEHAVVLTNRAAGVDALLPQPDGVLLVAGRFTSFAGHAVTNLVRLLADGTVDESFPIRTVVGTDLRLAALRDGSVLLGGALQSVNGIQTRVLGKLLPDGSLDPNFHRVGDFEPALAIVPLADDGAMVLANSGGTYNQTRSGTVFRLNSDGRLDSTFFAPPQLRATVIVPETNGGWLVAGRLDILTATASRHLRVLRLAADGALDPKYPPDFSVNSQVNSLQLLPDGKLLVAGQFHLSELGRAEVTNLVRLFPDGRLDTSFQPASVPAGVVAMALGGDGNIYVAGADNSLERLKPDGRLDTSFVSSLHPAFNTRIYCLALQADGRLLLGGTALATARSTNTGLVRLLPDGSADATFWNNRMFYSATVYGMAIQASGRLLLSTDHLVRLFPNGETDPSFAPDIAAEAIAVDPHDDVLVYGTVSNSYRGFRHLAGYASPVVGPFLGAKGTVSLKLYGETGTQWQTETSTDLRDWKPLGVRTIPSTNQLTVTVPLDTNSLAQFYRVTRLP